MKINHIKVYFHHGKIAEYIDTKDFTIKELIPSNLILDNQVYLINYSFKAINKNYKVFQTYFVLEKSTQKIRFFDILKKRKDYDLMKISNNYAIGDSYSQKLSINDSDKNIFWISICNKNKIKNIIIHTNNIDIVFKILNNCLKIYDLLYVDLETLGCKMNSKFEILEFSNFNKINLHIRYHKKKTFFDKISNLFTKSNYTPRIINIV
jgi:hypothetical protein